MQTGVGFNCDGDGCDVVTVIGEGEHARVGGGVLVSYECLGYRGIAVPSTVPTPNHTIL